MEEGGLIQAEGRDDDDDEIFVYIGGDQFVPRGVRRVRIDKSVKIIPRRAFDGRQHLIYVEYHEGVEIIREDAFCGCISLRSVKLLGVKFIGNGAFRCCWGLTEVEFGVELETIEERAFQDCTSLTSLTMPSVKLIRRLAFSNCRQLTDLDLPEGLETIEEHAFSKCQRLGRISIPLKDNMVGVDVFWRCFNLRAVDLVGGIHNTVASLHLESWRNEMKEEINRINQVLPNTSAAEKTAVTQQWIRAVTRRLNHYSAEHRSLVKEATTLLELALWKANLDHNEGGVREREGVRTTRGRRKRARKEICITSGASIVIKNVLPFLELK